MSEERRSPPAATTAEMLIDKICSFHRWWKANFRGLVTNAEPVNRQLTYNDAQEQTEFTQVYHLCVRLDLFCEGNTPVNQSGDNEHAVNVGGLRCIAEEKLDEFAPPDNPRRMKFHMLFDGMEAVLQWWAEGQLSQVCKASELETRAAAELLVVIYICHVLEDFCDGYEDVDEEIHGHAENIREIYDIAEAKLEAWVERNQNGQS
jgi:hypothetical protein